MHRYLRTTAVGLIIGSIALAAGYFGQPTARPRMPHLAAAPLLPVPAPIDIRLDSLPPDFIGTPEPNDERTNNSTVP